MFLIKKSKLLALDQQQIAASKQVPLASCSAGPGQVEETGGPRHSDHQNQMLSTGRRTALLNCCCQSTVSSGDRCDSPQLPLLTNSPTPPLPVQPLLLFRVPHSLHTLLPQGLCTCCSHCLVLLSDAPVAPTITSEGLCLILIVSEKPIPATYTEQPRGARGMISS